MEIAVLVNANGETSGFEKDGIVRIYTKEQGSWAIKKHMEYSINEVSNATLLREKINEICSFLMDCNIMVVNRIRGIHYIAFEEHMVSMLEIPGNPENFLEDLKECCGHQRKGQNILLEHNAVFEAKPGYFYTDLREVMSGNTSYSSKQILLPFIKNHKFNCIEVICGHVPKWLEREQTELKLIITVENYKECMKVKIYPSKTRGDNGWQSQ